MDFLRSAYDMLPRRLRRSPGPPEQAVLSIKTAATLLCATCSLQTGSGVSELPYYGLSPPVYPSRKVYQPPRYTRRPHTDRSANAVSKQLAMVPAVSAGPRPTPLHGAWFRR
jgi:hypothetical protein